MLLAFMEFSHGKIVYHKNIMHCKIWNYKYMPRWRCFLFSYKCLLLATILGTCRHCIKSYNTSQEISTFHDFVVFWFVLFWSISTKSSWLLHWHCGNLWLTQYKWNNRKVVALQLSSSINGLVQQRSNSSALAMELHLSCTNPSIYQ